MRRDGTDGREAEPPPEEAADGFASEGRNYPRAAQMQEPKATPSKRNSDAHCQPPDPQGLADGTSEDVRSTRGGVRLTANSQ